MRLLVICSIVGLAACGRPAPAPIQVVEASYGLNCDAGQAGNVTEIVKPECNGETSCSFAVSHASGVTADPCPGQPKDFTVSYRCADRQKTLKIADSAKKLVILNCGR